MAQKTTPPKYRRQKRRTRGDLAFVEVDGVRTYLGEYGSDESRERYGRLIAESKTTGQQAPVVDDGELTVKEFLLSYLRWAMQSYPPKEVSHIRVVIRAMDLYTSIPVPDFGPLALKVVRQCFVDQGHVRSYVNDNVGRIRRVFRWGVENELVPVDVLRALEAVSGLRQGRTKAPEGKPVTPVPEEYVDAIRPYVSRQVWAIVELQRLTGMRPGEVVIMRGRDLDMAGTVWMYRPALHKTQHRGHERIVEIGPRAQEIIRPFLKPDLEAPLFSPADAETERRAELHAKRKTPMSCGNRPGTNRKQDPARTPKDRYTSGSYLRAITRACDSADQAAKKRRNLPADDERIVPRWHPHQLRHSYATRVRREYGIETARILLGHRSAFTTEIYAEVDRMKAREIVAGIG